MNSYNRLSLKDRIELSCLWRSGHSKSEIARRLNRHRSTIGRELSSQNMYSALESERKAIKAAASRNKGKSKIQKCYYLEEYIKKHVRVLKWSPVQISNSLALLYPKDMTMQISHESIYTYIYLLGRGELKKELIGGLRQRKRLRTNRKAVRYKPCLIPDMISIEERPKEVEDRSLAGHWEGDLIVGKAHKSALGVIVERKTRAVILVPLKSKDACSVREAFEKELKTLPKQMRLA